MAIAETGEDLIDYNSGNDAITGNEPGWATTLHNLYFSGDAVADREHAGGTGTPAWLNEFSANILAREGNFAINPPRAAQFRAGGRLINNLCSR